MGRALSGAWAQFRGVLPYLVIGAVIYGFVPAEWVARMAGPQNPLAIPMAAVIGIPLYIRVETMIPIGMVLLQKGMALIIGGGRGQYSRGQSPGQHLQAAAGYGFCQEQVKDELIHRVRQRNCITPGWEEAYREALGREYQKHI